MPSKAKLIQEGLNVLEALAKDTGLLREALEAKTPPATTPRGGRLFPQAPMYTPDVPQVDLPRMKKVDAARAAGKKPAYTERMQSLLDSPTVRKKVDKLIEKGEELGMREWYGNEPLRQAAMEAGVSPEQYRSFMAQLASASQRNPVDQQNLMGSFLYHLQQSGQLPEESMLLTNKLRKQLRADPSLAEGKTLIELPSGYGSLAQSDIFERGRQIAGGDIEGALPPEAKLGTFYRNLLGNLRPVTVDVNAVRGPIIEQGDPRWLTSKLVEKDEEGNIKNVYFPRRMVEEGEMSVREAKQRPGFWEAAPSGSEYAGFEDLWQRAAKRHGVEPAEAQALGWYGSGDVTALKTKPELYIDNLERLIRRTAEIEGENPLQTMERILRGETFLKKKRGGSIDLESEFNMSKGGLLKKAIEAVKDVAAPAVSRIEMSFKDVTKRIPELTEAAKRLSVGEMSPDEYDALVNRVKPVEPYNFVPQPATAEEALAALSKDKAPRYGKTSEIEPGEIADLRLDIPAYSTKGVWVNSIHRKGKPTVYGSVSSVKNATMKGSSGKALKVATGETPKGPFAVISGEWQPLPEEEAVARAQEYLDHPEWAQIGYDPERHGYFYDRRTMEPILGADEIIQIGPLVLGKNPKYGPKADEPFARGGAAGTLAAMDTGKVEMRKAPGAKKAEKILSGAAEFLPFVGAGKAAAEGDYPSAALQGALDVAGGPLLKGAAALGGKAIPALAGIFIGPKSKLWNAEKARQFEDILNATGDPKVAYKRTGTFIGADGKLRQEISDEALRLRTPKELARMMDEKSREAADLRARMGFGNIKQRDLFPAELTKARAEAKPKLDELDKDLGAFEYDPTYHGLPARLAIDHPELFAAYPEMKDVMVRTGVRDLGKGVHAALELGVEAPTISLAHPSLVSKDFSTPEESLAHEFQHLVQHNEGFEGGSSPQDAFNMVAMHRVRELQNQGLSYTDALDQANREFKGRAGELYNRMAGEAESRATEARINMPMQQRLENFPPEQQYRDTYPYEQQLLQRDYGGYIPYKAGGEVHMADGGSPKYSTSQAIKDIVGGTLSNLESMARGSVAGLVGAPGDINELIRDTLGINPFPELPAAPTSERILKAVPRITAPRKESEGMEMLGSFVQPYGEAAAVAKQAAKKAAPAARAVAREALERGMESGAIVDPRMQVIKPVGGQWLTGYGGKTAVVDFPYLRHVDPRELNTGQKLIESLTAERAATTDPVKIASLDERIQLIQSGLDSLKKVGALSEWATKNVQNYARTQMGTPEDPILRLAEEWPAQKEQMLAERQKRLDELNAKKEGIRTMPVPADVRDPDAWRQARVRSVNEKIDQVKEDIERIEERNPIHMPVRRGTFKETAEARERAGFPREGLAKTEIGKGWEALTDSMIHSIEAGKLRDPNYMADLESRVMNSSLGVTGAPQASLEDIYLDRRFGRLGQLSRHKEMMSQNPWLSKVDPSTPIYKTDLQFGGGMPEASSLGFDHVMDVLRRDVEAGRIRPEQLSKMSMEQAVRRTADYDAEKAVQMKKATAEEAKNLTPHMDFDDGYRIVRLDKPGQFAKESQRMGHSVEGYEPPINHPDYVEASGDAGSQYYGHGGWEGIKSGKAQVFSLRDEKGMPHVTIELGPETWPKGGPVQAFDAIGKKYTEAMDEAMARIGITNGKFPEGTTEEQRNQIQKNFDNTLKDIFIESGGKMTNPITQIKGKRNQAPDEEYLPYVQKFIREGNYDIARDFQNSGLIDTAEYRAKSGLPNDMPRYITRSELDRYAQTGKFEPEFKSGGEVKMAKGGDMDLETKFQKAGDETYASRGQRRYGDREKGMTAATALEALYNMTRRQAASELKGAGPRAVTDVANNILADTLGMPVDMVNMMLGTVGLGSKRPVGGSEQLRNLMREYGMTTGTERPLTETAVSLLGPGAPRAATKIANVATVAAKRPLTPATLTVEATAPDLGQETSYGFRQGLNDALLAEMSKIGRRPATTREGVGAYINEANRLEMNPMLAVDIPGAGRIGEEGLHGDVTGAVRELRQKIAQAGVDLNQEAMAAHRFIPLPVNDIRDASAMLIKTPEGLDKDQIAKLATLLGNDMVVAHNPRLGGIVVYPFGPVGKEVPKEFLNAQSAANTILGKKAQIHYGVSDYDADRLFMMKSADEYEKAGAAPMSAEQAAKRERLQAMQKALFPDTSGIPGNVKAAPLGGIQGWSRGAAYPTHVQGIGINPDWQAINYATEERGPLRSSIEEAQEDQMSLLDKYHRALVGRNR